MNNYKFISILLSITLTSKHKSITSYLTRTQFPLEPNNPEHIQACEKSTDYLNIAYNNIHSNNIDHTSISLQSLLLINDKKITTEYKQRFHTS